VTSDAVFSKEIVSGATFKPEHLDGKTLTFYALSDDFLQIVYAEDNDGLRYIFDTEVLNERESCE